MGENKKNGERRPFLAIPDVGAYYPASSIQAARESIFRTLDRAEGAALVFGGAGVGKTLLLKLLASEFELDGPVLLIDGFRTPNRRAFLARMLFELHQPVGSGDEQSLRLDLFDYLRRSEYRRFVLLIDEAQSLPFSAFEELRLLLDQESFHSPLFRVALAGTDRFEERLNHPRLARFGQRVVSRSYLEPFLRDETGDYMERQLRQAGGRFADTFFTPNAKLFVHRSSEGVPRIVNQLCDLALWLGPDEKGAFDEATFRRAWGMLQQLPDETVSNAPIASRSLSDDFTASNDSENSSGRENSNGKAPAVVEFGTLDTDEPETPAPSERETLFSVETPISDAASRETVRFEEPNFVSEREPFEPAEEEEFPETDLSTLPLTRWDEEDSQEAETLEKEEPDRTEAPSGEKSSAEPAFDSSAPVKIPFAPGIERSSSEARAGYLEELRLLEMEVAQEAALIRKIRGMHTGLESFRDEPVSENLSEMRIDSLKKSAEQNEMPPKDAAELDSARKRTDTRARAPYRPNSESGRFRSAFKQLYPDE